MNIPVNFADGVDLKLHDYGFVLSFRLYFYINWIQVSCTVLSFAMLHSDINKTFNKRKKIKCSQYNYIVTTTHTNSAHLITTLSCYTGGHYCWPGWLTDANSSHKHIVYSFTVKLATLPNKHCDSSIKVSWSSKLKGVKRNEERAHAPTSTTMLPWVELNIWIIIRWCAISRS